MRNGPKYTPSSFCYRWRGFGSDDSVSFAPLNGDVARDGLIVANIQQHHFALRVRTAMKEQGLNMATLAQMTSMSRSKLVDVLNGERPLCLSDMGRLMVALCIDVDGA